MKDLSKLIKKDFTPNLMPPKFKPKSQPKPKKK